MSYGSYRNDGSVNMPYVILQEVLSAETVVFLLLHDLVYGNLSLSAKSIFALTIGVGCCSILSLCINTIR